MQLDDRPVVNTNVPLSVPRNHSGVFKTHWESGKVKNKNQQKIAKLTTTNSFELVMVTFNDKEALELQERGLGRQET